MAILKVINSYRPYFIAQKIAWIGSGIRTNFNILGKTRCPPKCLEILIVARNKRWRRWNKT